MERKGREREKPMGGGFEKGNTPPTTNRGKGVTVLSKGRVRWEGEGWKVAESGGREKR
jgi:hypothetical protein